MLIIWSFVLICFPLISQPLDYKSLFHEEPRWHSYAFRWFDRMNNPVYREYKYGFPAGMYGSSMMPVNLWFQLWCTSPTEEQFLHSKNTYLVTLDYDKIVTSCDEISYPGCSWHIFLALLYPSSYNDGLLKALFPFRMNYTTDNCLPVPVIHESCYPFKTLDQISLVYIFAVCHHLELNGTTELNIRICPNPCARQPCEKTENAVHGVCEKRGYHWTDYKCFCEQGYKWEDTTKTCALHTDCKKLCHRTNTEYCIVNRTTATSVCQCKDGFMGYDCSQPYDACVLGRAPDARGLNVGPIIPPGYEACGTTLDAHNLCFPVANTTSYTCVCSPAYVRDPSLPYDNCLKPLDSCDKRICVHGQCVTSPDLLRSICDCDDGFSGPLCDQPIGVWSQWSEWGACEPPCGPSRHRRRLRMCMSDNEGDCIGPVEEVRRCAQATGCVQDVPVEEEVWLDFVDWARYVMMVTLAYIGSLAILLSLLGLFKRYKPVQKDTDAQADKTKTNKQSPSEK